MQREDKMMLEKLHRGINGFHKAFNWRRFRRDALHLGESLLVFGILYGIFSTLIWGVCWIFKINYDPDLVAVAWAVPVLLDTLVNKAYDWNNEVRDWDSQNGKAWADLPAHHAAELRGEAARLPQGRGLTCWGQKEHGRAVRMGRRSGIICPTPLF